VSQSIAVDERRSAWRAITVFLVITIALSAVFEILMARQGKLTGILVTGVMWSPGVSALLTCLILKRPIASLPWRWGPWRWNLSAWALPIAYGLAIYLPVWIFGLGGSRFGNEDTLTLWSRSIVGGEGYDTLAIVFFLLVYGTVGLAGNAARALGEEIGWRGFLVWELRKVMPFWLVGLGSGLFWAMWHWPAILFTNYNAGEGNFYLQMLLFTLGIAPQGIVYAYFTFRSKSLWPAVLLHSAHNLFIQDVFTPLTVAGAGTHLYIDEFGIMLPIASCGLGLYFYRRARREGLA
jgi:membrane protease YdiL (CAAX protease family)